MSWCGDGWTGSRHQTCSSSPRCCMQRCRCRCTATPPPSSSRPSPRSPSPRCRTPPSAPWTPLSRSVQPLPVRVSPTFPRQGQSNLRPCLGQSNLRPCQGQSNFRPCQGQSNLRLCEGQSNPLVKVSPTSPPLRSVQIPHVKVSPASLSRSRLKQLQTAGQFKRCVFARNLQNKYLYIVVAHDGRNNDSDFDL